MIVKSKESRVRIIAGLFILPTLNVFSAEESNLLVKHPDFKEGVELGSFEILDVTSVNEKDLATAIEEVSEKITDDNEKISEVVALVKAANVDDAKELIAEILDEKQLKAIIDIERRKSVKRAAEMQLESLTTVEEESSTDTDEKEE